MSPGSSSAAALVAVLGAFSVAATSESAVPVSCGNGSFPYNPTGVQCWGGRAAPNATSPAACVAACCELPGCVWWGIAAESAAAKHKGCWISAAPTKCEAGRRGWAGGSVEHIPLVPNPSPQPKAGPLRLDRAAVGLRFDGLGAIVDAASRFIFDYPETQRQEIMDYLYAPHFGASLSIFKAEVGGDDQQTDGTTASYRHAVNDTPNFNRSHVFWAMREAARRRPSILVYGLAWGFPGFVGDFYSSAPGEYLAGWAKGVKDHVGLNVSVLGLWNERQSCSFDPRNKSRWNCDMIFGLREALDRSGLESVRIAGNDNSVGSFDGIFQTAAPIDIVATHGFGPLPPAFEAVRQAQGLPRWRSEAEDTYRSPADMAAHLVRDYLDVNVTATVEWPIAQGMYPSLPWAENPMFFYANSPWSGHYEVPPFVWVFAHLGQFAEPGWHYLRQGDGGGYLVGGGSYSALVSPDGTHISLLLETTGARAAQPVTAVLPASVLAGRPRSVEVWRSFVTANSTAQYFLKQEPVPISTNGTVSLVLPPGTLTTVTTAVGLARKGDHGPSPPSTAFPLPYRVNYTALSLHRQGPYHTDQRGSFEVAEVGGVRGLLQTVTEAPIAWVFAAPRPISILGDIAWENVTVRSRATILGRSPYRTTALFSCKETQRYEVQGRAQKLPTPVGGDFVSVGVRSMEAGNICGAGKDNTRGYYLLVHANATWTLTKGSQHVLAHGATGLSARDFAPPWPAADDGLAPLRNLTGLPLDLELTASGCTLHAAVNGKTLTVAQDDSFSSGFAAIASGWHLAMFQSLSVMPAEPSQ